MSMHQSDAEEIEIRRARSPFEFRALQDVQRRTWGISDESLILPIASMVAADHFGGLVLGGFRANGDAVALSFAFLGRLDDRLVLYSQLRGVQPSHQSRGLGRRLKEVQRGFCQTQKIGAIAWAFDPFQPGNARFNLNRLGATCSQWIEDMYGPRNDALNAGMPTDRLIAVWELDADKRVETPANIVDPQSSRLFIEIPASLSQLRGEDPDLAGWIRFRVRRDFYAAFAEGYRAVEFTTTTEGRCGYLLDRLEFNGRPQP